MWNNPESVDPLGNAFYNMYGLSLNRYSYQPRIWQTQQETADDTDTNYGYPSANDKLPPDEEKPNWNQGPVGKSMFVRLLLIGHNLLTVWRVVEAYDNNLYWLLSITNLLILIEGQYMILNRAGIEPSWWCPCFLLYLSTTIPCIWLLQLNQYDGYIAAKTSQDRNTVFNATTLPTSSLNSSVAANVSPQDVNLVTQQSPSEEDLWVIIVEESLVYLLVFSRWILPRGENVSREFIADLLLEFLAIAADIMELLALFDEDVVRSNLQLTYVIMAVWSVSFIQFIPILVHKRRCRHVRSPRIKWITRVCGDKFIEIVVTCMGIFLQDGPFLVVRLYIMVEINLVTYSLVFFVLKNIVTLMLLFYRLIILCLGLPCLHKRKDELESVVFADMDDHGEQEIQFGDVYDTK